MTTDTSTEPADDPKTPAPDAEASATTYPFQAEVSRVLTLVIDSLYANKEVFLRELISNASDALDKARFFALTHEEARKQEGEPRIEISVNEDAHTLTIEDNGIGMTRDDVVAHLGTIAKSGTVELLERLKSSGKDKDAALQLIGQFGVGFYSAFMVADRVDVHTLSMHPEGTPVIWRSTGAGSFTVAPGDRTTPGTRIVLHLKDEHRDFIRAWRLKDVIQKYSDYVGFPILMEGERANRPVALWTEPRNKVTSEQHAEFFKHLTGGTQGDAPLLTVHLAIDAPTQFNALLYVPSKAPFDLFNKEQRRGLKLYTRKVLILEDCERVLPIWLRFVRGVVDSEDLSLNVSREMLQESRALATIEQQIVKQLLKAMKELSESEPEKYAELWRLFGKVLKEGISSDWKNKDAIVELTRFESMKTKEGELTSLRKYVDAMPEAQREIYFITGLGRKAVADSPHLEAFRKKGFDVLFLTDPIDEWIAQSVPDYDKRKLRSVTHGEVDLGEEAAEGPPAAVAAIKSALGDRVKAVRFSKRLTDSPSCLVAEEGDPGANMERILRLMDERALEKKRILEINPTHPVVKNIAALAEKEPGSERVGAYCEWLYDHALLAEGVVEDPAKLVKRLGELLTQATASAVEHT
jgi:molecular chaperone HtpG